MLDNPETKAKNKLGMTWEREAGKKNFRYMMIFKNKSSDENTYTISEAIDLLRDL